MKLRDAWAWTLPACFRRHCERSKAILTKETPRRRDCRGVCRGPSAHGLDPWGLAMTKWGFHPAGSAAGRYGTRNYAFGDDQLAYGQASRLISNGALPLSCKGGPANG